MQAHRVLVLVSFLFDVTAGAEELKFVRDARLHRKRTDEPAALVEWGEDVRGAPWVSRAIADDSFQTVSDDQDARDVPWVVSALADGSLHLPNVASRPKKGTPIPKLVHHVYKTDLSNGPWPNPIWEKSYKSWTEMFPAPAFQHIFWSDDKVAHLFQSRCSKHYNVYAHETREIVRSDFSRYCILSTLGGIYADLDYEPRQGFYEDLWPGRVNLVESPYADERVQNSLMASPPGHPYWNALLNLAASRLGADSDVLKASGPALLTSLSMTGDPNMVHILPCNQFQRATHLAFGEAEAATAKHCKSLTAGDARDSSLKGIHWGTVSWQHGSGETISLFQAFSSLLQGKEVSQNDQDGEAPSLVDDGITGPFYREEQEENNEMRGRKAALVRDHEENDLTAEDNDRLAAFEREREEEVRKLNRDLTDG